MNLLPRHSIIDFDSFFSPNFWPSQKWFEEEKQATSFMPRADVKETKKGYEITAELPGVEKDNVQVSLNQGVLTIEAELNQEDKEEKDGKIIRQERRYGKFFRSFDLGQNMNESDIKADFKNGVLKLNFPKPKGIDQTTKKIAVK